MGMKHELSNSFCKMYVCLYVCLFFVCCFIKSGSLWEACRVSCCLWQKKKKVTLLPTLQKVLTFKMHSFESES